MPTCHVLSELKGTWVHLNVRSTLLASLPDHAHAVDAQGSSVRGMHNWLCGVLCTAYIRKNVPTSTQLLDIDIGSYTCTCARAQQSQLQNVHAASEMPKSAVFALVTAKRRRNPAMLASQESAAAAGRAAPEAHDVKVSCFKKPFSAVAVAELWIDVAALAAWCNDGKSKTRMVIVRRFSER